MLHAPQSGITAAALVGEALMPANCFRLTSDRCIVEGLLLELGHPQVGGKTALFIGGFYIFRNNYFGCVFEKQDGQGFVRRAIIERKQLAGRPPFPLLTQPNSGNPPLLLHATTFTKAAPNITLNVKFARDIVTDGDVIAQSQGEMLIGFADGDSADILYQDGSVKRVVRVGGSLVTSDLSIKEQAVIRVARDEGTIALLSQEIEQARVAFAQPDQMKIRKRDEALHDLVSVLEVGGRRDSDVFDLVFAALVRQGKEGNLHATTVRKRATGVLKRFYPKRVMEFEEACLANAFAHRVDFDLAVAGPLAKGRKGPDADRKAKIAARSQRDAARRAEMKGPSGGGTQARSKKK